MNHLIDQAGKTQIVQDQKANPATNVITGKSFADEESNQENGNGFDMSSLFTIDGQKLQSAFTFDQSVLAAGLQGADLGASMDLSGMNLDLSSLPAFDASSILSLIHIFFHIGDVAVHAVGQRQDGGDADDADAARERCHERAALLREQVLKRQGKRREERHAGAASLLRGAARAILGRRVERAGIDVYKRQALDDGGGADDGELGLVLELGDGKRTAVAHGGLDLQQRDRDVVLKRAGVRHVGVDALLERQALLAAQVVTTPVKMCIRDRQGRCDGRRRCRRRSRWARRCRSP